MKCRFCVARHQADTVCDTFTLKEGTLRLSMGASQCRVGRTPAQVVPSMLCYLVQTVNDRSFSTVVVASPRLWCSRNTLAHRTVCHPLVSFFEQSSVRFQRFISHVLMRGKGCRWIGDEDLCELSVESSGTSSWTSLCALLLCDLFACLNIQCCLHCVLSRMVGHSELLH